MRAQWTGVVRLEPQLCLENWPLSFQSLFYSMRVGLKSRGEASTQVFAGLRALELPA